MLGRLKRSYERSQRRSEAADVMTPPTDAAEARQAVADATGKLAESNRRWPAVRRVAAGMEQLQRENHLAEKVAEAFRAR